MVERLPIQVQTESDPNVEPKKPRQVSERTLKERIAEQEYTLQLTTLVYDSIANGLSHFGGPKVAEAILYLLELDYGVNVQDFTISLQNFRIGLRSMFGSSSKVIEDHIRVQLAKRIGINPEGKSLDDLLRFAKDYIISNGSLTMENLVVF